MDPETVKLAFECMASRLDHSPANHHFVRGLHACTGWPSIADTYYTTYGIQSAGGIARGTTIVNEVSYRYDDSKIASAIVFGNLASAMTANGHIVYIYPNKIDFRPKGDRYRYRVYKTGDNLRYIVARNTTYSFPVQLDHHDDLINGLLARKTDVNALLDHAMNY